MMFKKLREMAKIARAARSPVLEVHHGEGYAEVTVDGWWIGGNDEPPMTKLNFGAFASTRLQAVVGLVLMLWPQSEIVATGIGRRQHDL